jgi:hypothetical protein
LISGPQALGCLQVGFDFQKDKLKELMKINPKTKRKIQNKINKNRLQKKDKSII